MTGITDLFFKRKKREQGEYPDIYQYDSLSKKLKIQIIHIWRESLGEDRPGDAFYSATRNRGFYENIYNILLKELGLLELGRYSPSLFKRIAEYFLNEPDVNICISIIELVSKHIEAYSKLDKQINLQETIKELNERFKENGVGYQYENGQIVRIDSQYIHIEAVKPALILLNKPVYKRAQIEFLSAHDHYLHKRYQEAIADCLKAYESTLKIILKKRQWGYKENDTADALTGKAIQNGLIPDYWNQYFKSLKNTLTTGVPTARNKVASHGQADEKRIPPDYLVSYILHITASAILFLIRAEENL